MRKALFLLLMVPLAPGLAQLNAATYVEGRVASMRSVQCGSQVKSHKRMEQMLCEEYVVRTDRTDYRIRQELPKKVNLLPVGQEVYFRVKKNRMVVRGYALNGEKIRDQEYVVVSEHPRAGVTAPGGP